jgi:hypothetical protein
MDSDWIKQPEIQLEASWSLSIRLCVLGAALLFLGFEIAGFVAQADAYSRGDNAKLLVILFCCGLLIFDSLFKSNVRWIIRRYEIQIDRSWINGRRQCRVRKER